MKLSNEIESHISQCSNTLIRKILKNLSIMLAPMAPHVASEIFHSLTTPESNQDVFSAIWPQAEAVEASMYLKKKLIVQINGKFFKSITYDPKTLPENLLSLVKVQFPFKFEIQNCKTVENINNKVFNFLF